MNAIRQWLLRVWDVLSGNRMQRRVAHQLLVAAQEALAERADKMEMALLPNEWHEATMRRYRKRAELIKRAAKLYDRDGVA